MQERDNRFQSRNVFFNILWKFLERGSAVAVTLLVNIILARLLDPSVHGLLAMVTVFVTITEIFVTAGLGSALIQKKDADKLDFSTIFWMNLTVSAILYLSLFCASPSIAQYFGYEELSPILRVLSLRLIISAVNSIQCAYISRNMLFRYYFYSTLSGKILSGTIGIILAFAGAGVWALVAQSVSLTLIETIVLWLRVQWRPTMQFSWERGRDLYKFAYRVMFTSFVETITDQVRSLLIGKHYTSADLAYYNKGILFPNSITTNVTSALSAVMYPVLANKQEDLTQIKTTTRQWIKMFSYCMFPLLTGMATTADQWIPLILSEKWSFSVPYLQIACGLYAAWIVEVPIREAIKSIGRADICLKMQIIKAALSLCVLLLVFKKGVFVIALSALGCAGFNVLVSVFNALKFLHYSPREITGDIAMPVLFSACVALCVLLIEQVINRPLFCFLVQAISGIIVYVALSVFTKNKELRYAMDLFGIMRRK